MKSALGLNQSVRLVTFSSDYDAFFITMEVKRSIKSEARGAEQVIPTNKISLIGQSYSFSLIKGSIFSPSKHCWTPFYSGWMISISLIFIHPDSRFLLSFSWPSCSPPSFDYSLTPCGSSANHYSFTLSRSLPSPLSLSCDCE